MTIPDKLRLRTRFNPSVYLYLSLWLNPAVYLKYTFRCDSTRLSIYTCHCDSTRLSIFTCHCDSSVKYTHGIWYFLHAKLNFYFELFTVAFSFRSEDYRKTRSHKTICFNKYFLFVFFSKNGVHIASLLHKTHLSVVGKAPNKVYLCAPLKTKQNQKEIIWH